MICNAMAESDNVVLILNQPIFVRLHVSWANLTKKTNGVHWMFAHWGNEDWISFLYKSAKCSNFYIVELLTNLILKKMFHTPSNVCKVLEYQRA